MYNIAAEIILNVLQYLITLLCDPRQNANVKKRPMEEKRKTQKSWLEKRKLAFLFVCLMFRPI